MENAACAVLGKEHIQAKEGPLLAHVLVFSKTSFDSNPFHFFPQD